MPGKISCACGKQYTWSAERAGKRARCKCGEVVQFPEKDPELLTDDDVDQLIRDLPAHETSPSGAPIYRHETRSKPLEIVTGDSESIEAIAEHIARYIGPPDNVFHEIVSDLVHIDVHVVEPSDERPWYTLVTSGMSDRPMTVPDPDDPEQKDLRYAEMLVCLPPDWPLAQEAFEDENNYWPIRWLKNLARLPHEYDTWLGWGHTVPNGDPAEPVAEGTKLCCMMVMHPVLAPEEFLTLEVSPEKKINFYAMFPLYREEVDLKLKKGAEALVEKFQQAQVSEIIDPTRKNTCKKRFGLF